MNRYAYYPYQKEKKRSSSSRSLSHNHLLLLSLLSSVSSSLYDLKLLKFNGFSLLMIYSIPPWLNSGAAARLGCGLDDKDDEQEERTDMGVGKLSSSPLFYVPKLPPQHLQFLKWVREIQVPRTASTAAACRRASIRRTAGV